MSITVDQVPVCRLPLGMAANETSDLPRRAGRRPKSANGDAPAGITRETIVALAVNLAQREPIEGITMVRLARELGVAQSLLYYFAGSRDELLSAVMNEALKARAESYPALTGHWRVDLEAFLRQTHELQLKWKGITTYVTTHNRHRLFQRVGPGEQDYGMVFFDRAGRILMSAGLSQAQAATTYHLLMLFLTSVASAHINRQEPAAHKSFLTQHLSKFDSTEFSGAAFLMGPFSELDTATTFECGLGLFLDAIERMVPASANKRLVAVSR